MPTDRETKLEYVNEYRKLYIRDGASPVTKLLLLKRKNKNAKHEQNRDNKRIVIP